MYKEPEVKYKMDKDGKLHYCYLGEYISDDLIFGG